MNHADPSKTEFRFPFPPRYWWLKRGGTLVVLAVIALVLLRVWWGHEAAVRYQALVASAHRAGQPILPEDFDPDPVPANQNAALSLKKAAAGIVSNSQYDALENSHMSGPFTVAELRTLKTTFAANATPLRLVRLAQSQPSVNWGVKARTPVFISVLPPAFLRPQRQLARLLQRDALYRHQIGDDREAIQLVRDVLRQELALRKGPAVLIHSLVAGNFGSLAITTLDQIAPDLRVSIGPHATNGPAPAGRKQVMDLIHQLLDDAPVRQGVIHCWRGEQMCDLDMARDAANRRTGIGLGRPLFQMMGIQIVRQVRRDIEASAKPNWSAARRLIPAKGISSHVQMILDLYADITVGSLDRASVTLFRELTVRHVAAMELAIRLYRIDHQNAYPHTLQELVPIYLPYVPSDPMAPDNHAIRYQPAAMPPALYSVSENGIDDGGANLPANVNGNGPWQTPDAVFPLEPAAQPATQPVTTQPAATQPSAKTHDHQ